MTRPGEWSSLPREPVDILIHAAAMIPGDDDDTPQLTSGVNLQGSLHAMEWARERGISRFLLVSSSTVYRGALSDSPLKEDPHFDPPASYASNGTHWCLFRREYLPPAGDWDFNYDVTKPGSVEYRCTTDSMLRISSLDTRLQGCSIESPGLHRAGNCTEVPLREGLSSGRER